MKHRIFVKTIALLLMLVMLLGAMPLSVFSADAEEAPVRILYEGEQVERVSLLQDEKLTLTTAVTPMGEVDYHWQIKTTGVRSRWVNISDRQESTCDVSYALIGSMLDAGGCAQLRVTVTADGVTYESLPVVVEVSFAVRESAMALAAEQPLAPQLFSLRAAVGATRGVAVTLANEEEAAESSDADEDIRNVYVINIHYVYKDGTIAAEKKSLEIPVGDPVNLPIANPRVVGYDPELREEYEGVSLVKAADGSSKLQFSIHELNEPRDIYVVYQPGTVVFTVHHHKQNLHDDQYESEPFATVTMYGKTGESVGDCHIEIEGFHALYYERMTIAADGSTQLEIYYDREYYLVDFDLSGGFGQEPIYTRYESEISVNEVTRPGYIFVAWQLLSVGGHLPSEEDIGNYLFTEEKTVVSVKCNLEYDALWTLGETTYTLVFWRENADDNNYSYWASMTVTTDENGDPLKMGSVVDAYDWIDRVPEITDSAHFIFNHEHSDVGVELKGDGSTVVNAYYMRERFTITFKGKALCGLPEGHTHTTDCYLALCGKPEHVHDESCNLDPICGRIEHTAHVGCSYICGMEEHLAHTDDCMLCQLEQHLHGADCCVLPAHTHSAICCTKPQHQHSAECCTAPAHTVSCYRNVGEQVSEPVNAATGGTFPTDAGEGELFVVRVREGFWYTYYYRYIQIDGLWYRYTASSGSTGQVVTPRNCNNNAHHSHGDGGCVYCSLEEHVHGDGCDYTSCTYTEHAHDGTSCQYCDKTEHLHTDACYRDKIHHHMDYCCPLDIHTHTLDCYSCEEHVHHGDALLLICDQPEGHTHGGTCLSASSTNTLKIVTRKYQESLADLWPVVDGNGVVYDQGERWKPSDSSYYSEVLVYLANMPADDFTLTLDISSNSTYTMHYMLEVLPSERGDEGVENRNGRYYKEAFVVKANYGRVTEAEDFFDIKGFKKNGSNPAFSNGSISSSKNVYFYYTRKTGDEVAFKFQNVNTVVATHTGDHIFYGVPLGDYRDYVPPYPTTYEPNAYRFAGWYLSPECVAGTEVDWDTLSMPDGSLTVYAKWVPVHYTVKIFLDASLEEAEQIGETQTVEHGKLLNEPTHPTNGSLVFSGWFYTDANGIEKAFVFNAIPVKSDMNIYAKWSSRVAVQYIVRYAVKLADGTEIEIAAPTLGSTIAGQNRTFEAKGSDELYEGYRVDYFPTVARSHSIIMKADEVNTYTFYYERREAVPYTVRYLDAATGDPLLPDKVVPDNRLAAVTETFVPYQGYMPDSYQKRLVVSTEGENLLIFYYFVDEEHSYYRIVHYWEDLDGSGYSEYSHTEIKGMIGSTCTAGVISIDGFGFARAEINGVAVTPDADGNVSAVLGKEGMLIAFYYDRKTVEYTIEFVDYDDPTRRIVASVLKTGIYGMMVEEMAPDLSAFGYSRVSEPQKSITLKSSERNVITFMYQEQLVDFHYVGRVEDTIIGSYGYENVLAVTGAPLGCQSFGSIDYTFVGWFKDEACTIPVVPGVDPVTIDEDGNLTPVKVTKVVDGETVSIFESATYYILFDYNYVELTIQVEGCTDPDQTFLFHVQGVDASNASVNIVVAINGNSSVTIEQLRVGSYRVTQASSWSWRYEPNETTQVTRVSNEMLAPPVIFDQRKVNDQWLNGNGYTQIMIPVE